MPYRGHFLGVVALGAALASASLPATQVLAQPAKTAPSKQPSTTSALLDRAQGMFDDQKYEESIQTLSAALVRPGNTADEKTSVLKLLAFNYIAMGRTEEADAAVRAIYVTDEKYELPKGESPRFRDFFKKTKEAWVSEGKPGKAATGAPPPIESTAKIEYSPPAQAEANSTVKLEGKITDDPDARVVKVMLAVKTPSDGKFKEEPLVFSMGSFRGEIKPTSVQSPLVEFYLLALDKDGLPLASRGDVDAPLRIAVPAKGRSAGFWVGAVVVPVTLVVGAAIAIPAVYFATKSSKPSGPGTAHITVVITE